MPGRTTNIGSAPHRDGDIAAQEAGGFVPAYCVTDALISVFKGKVVVTSQKTMTGLSVVLTSGIVIPIIKVQTFKRFGRF